MHQTIAFIGSLFLALSSKIGSFALFLRDAWRSFKLDRFRTDLVVRQMDHIGVGSLSIIIITGTFTGLAIALQSYIGFHRVGAENFIGLVVTLAMTRELGPVLAGLMLTARVGSAMAAEIGSMKVTEQIEALQTLSINPFNYLVVPRIAASMAVFPFMTAFCTLFGILGSSLFCIHVLDINAEIYMGLIRERLTLGDIIGGLAKSVFFGLIMASISTFQGYNSSGGARGVGYATTKTVVFGCISILVSNYLLTIILFKLGLT